MVTTPHNSASFTFSVEYSGHVPLVFSEHERSKSDHVTSISVLSVCLMWYVQYHEFYHCRTQSNTDVLMKLHKAGVLAHYTT